MMQNEKRIFSLNLPLKNNIATSPEIKGTQELTSEFYYRRVAKI
jgi:hypothetical protein